MNQRMRRRTILHVWLGIGLLLLSRPEVTTAGDLNVNGNLNVTNNLTANAITLGGQTRSNWTGGATDLASPVLDFSQPGSFYRITLTNNTTWAFTNHVAGSVVWLQVAQNGTGGWLNYWPDGLLWPDGFAIDPPVSSNSLCVYRILDNGVSWLAQAEGLNYKRDDNFALKFDGGYGIVPTNSAFSSGNLTVECWVKYTTPHDGYVVTDYANDVNTWYLGVAQYYGNVGFCGRQCMDISGTKVINDGEWHHLAMVIDSAANQTRLYVDDQLDATGSYITTSGSHAVEISGRVDLHCTLYHGIADEIRISDNVRYTGTEITPKGSSIADSHTIAFWKFNEGSGTNLTDSSTHGHTGTMQGSPQPAWVRVGSPHYTTGFWQTESTGSMQSLDLMNGLSSLTESGGIDQVQSPLP